MYCYINRNNCYNFFLKLSDGFTKPLFSFITILGYIVSFYLLSIIVKELPIGIVYAVWSGMGIILASFYWLFFV
ncbi:SMR family transporter [Acinetobacter baumannii]|nr:SMR family transporter [Acinetobacter baumannii]MDF8285505.1 SMR family transporter [Acinetobacter baumannii]MDN8283040.1 SMR family transporter [Acinetobacter baumannii]MDN8364712.1 SMR family transporter [Acinetobacter baumannii]MDP7850505.1 SMR family transporter [Acinetobacter baumannii]MDP7907878.1 SMR family transporter [Acinetobacter baumannii]